MRLDSFLFEHNLAKSRSFAKTLVEEGYVTVNGKKAAKPSLDVNESDEVQVIGSPYDFVSRGGVKLEAALIGFSVNVRGKTCIDIGASSGGFTDCLLQKGAKKVYAVDSGHDQLAEKLQEDERVVNIEGYNARNLCKEDIGELCDVAVTDVSFISQTLIIPAAVNVLKDGGKYISLIKPQFECGKEGLGKGGIVKDKKIMAQSIKRVVDCATQNNLGCKGIIKSPIQGGDGNTEFLMCCVYGEDCAVTDEMIKGAVEQ